MNFAYQPISNSLVSDYTSPAQRGTLFGVLHGLTFGIGALAATIAGAIGDRWDIAAIFIAPTVSLG